MSNFKDLTGIKFNKLTVLKRVENDKSGNCQWLCKCDCGNTTKVRTSQLKSGKTKSCGCIKSNSVKEAQTKHGMSSTRLYGIWHHIKLRCTKPYATEYKYYGQRGIKYASEWEVFEQFYKWAVNNGYSDELTIDRIDVNGNYEPSNCRWITLKEQANNRTNSHFVTYNGETHTISEWAEKLNINRDLLYDRINRSKWSVEKALTTPKRIRSKKNV